MAVGGSARFLVCAATPGELAAFPTFPTSEGVRRVVSGVGIPATFAALMPLLEREKPEYILNIGIAGAYLNVEIDVGDIICATGEVYGDIGFELPEPPGFRPIADSDFGEFYRVAYSLTPPALPAPLTPPDDFRVHSGRGCTVNSCTGTDATGRRRAQQYDAVFETMEGAAVAQVGQLYGVPVCEIRAISNLAADRDMRPENIRRALGNLERFLAVLFV